MTQGLLLAMRIFWPVENKPRQSVLTADIIMGSVFCYKSWIEHEKKLVVESTASRGGIKVYHLGAEDKLVCYFNIFEISFSKKFTHPNHYIPFAFWWFSCCLHKTEYQICKLSPEANQMAFFLASSAQRCAVCWCIALTWWLNIWWEMTITNRELWISWVQIQSHLLH